MSRLRLFGMLIGNKTTILISILVSTLNLKLRLRSPATVEDIQKIVRLANRYVIPLWTTSQGKNLGYGGPAPVVLGSVVLALYRMSRILEVNEKMAYAVVEPGVSFHDLAQHCSDHSPSVWPSVPFISWGSVVGNVSFLTNLFFFSFFRIPPSAC